MAQFNRFAVLGGLTAALAFAATPAAAAELPSAASAFNNNLPTYDVFDADALTAEHHRRWRYRGYRGYRHRNRIDAGDVLAGVLVIGGIAAIASAASNSERRERRYRDERYRDYRDDRRDYRDRRDTRRSSGSGRGIDGAVDQCLTEIERDVRVDQVDSVDRTGQGWRVTGTIFNGDRFTCTIDENGRIEAVDYGAGFAAATSAPDNQYSDDRYRAAWANVDSNRASSSPEPQGRAEQLPAYPGGPIDGDLEGEASDDRYTMALAPSG